MYCGRKLAKFHILLYTTNLCVITILRSSEAANLPAKSKGTGGRSSSHFTREDKSTSEVETENPYGFPRERDKWLGKADPSSFSNPEDIITQSMHINWKVDFSNRSIYGYISYNLRIVNSNTSNLIFDIRHLNISKVTTSNQDNELVFEVGQNVSTFGQPLVIQVESLVKKAGTGNNFTIEIHYSTTEEGKALHWFDPEHTNGKKLPYLFSLCQSINARSLLPCQDTPMVKAPFTAKVKVSKDFQALMGAALIGECWPEGEYKIYNFQQEIPIPSYLIAIAVGAIVGKKLGPRSTVWTEKEVIDLAASELVDVERMIQIGEQLFGKYVWGQYDVLVLPPSFAYGGMEHPSMTFATSAILTGDKSLVNVIAHEIAHSWTGNLVSNKNWEHFWLNEGFTQFAERKILGVMHGEPFRHLASLSGLKELNEEYEWWGVNHNVSRLVPDLNGIDPDSFFSLFPYEKGCTFLFYLEQKVGGPSSFEPFLREFIRKYRFKSIETDDFKASFINYFTGAGAAAKIADIKWDDWLYTTGLPPEAVEYDKTLYMPCTNLSHLWMDWNKTLPIPSSINLDKFLPEQIIEFIQELVDAGTLPLETVRAIDKTYNMTSRVEANPEMRVRWTRVCIRARYSDILPSAFRFINEQLALKYSRLVYRELFWWEEVQQRAIDNLKKNSRKFQRVTFDLIRLDLHNFHHIDI